ncbi:MAG: hypothetical protein PHC83_05135 [Bacteroidales bacterium]|nr:hypothetical protein [Bacteroidales bacterium]
MKKYFYISAIMLYFFVFFIPNYAIGQYKIIPNGKWICVQDSSISIVIKGKFIFEYYNDVGIDTTKYFLTNESCDLNYKPYKKKAFFLIWDNDICYEIVGFTKKYIELIYTANGKTFTFYKCNSTIHIKGNKKGSEFYE